MRQAERLSVTLAEFSQRMRKLRQAMESAGVDLAVITQPEHYAYFAGYEPTSVFYYQAFFVPREEDQPPVLLVNKAEYLLAVETSWVEDIRVVWTAEDQVAKTMQVIQENGWVEDGATVWLNLSGHYMQPRYYLGLAKALPRAQFSDGSAALDELRLVKSAAEIDYLRRAAHIADLGVTAGINAIFDGVMDHSVMAAIQHDVALNGGEFPGYPTLVDARGTLHGRPIGKLLRSGSVIYLEVDGVVRRYHANISRTVVIGQPPDELLKLYEVVREAIDLCTEAMRPGVSVPEIVEIASRVRRGYEQDTWGRFGFSLEITYPPTWIGALSLMEGDTHVLEPGMVVTVEPGLTYHEGLTMMLGNNVLVTEDRPEVLNNVPLDLFIR